MATLAQRFVRLSVVLALSPLLLSPALAPAQDHDQLPDHECSVSKTNTSCYITVDRSNPVTPPTIQMYSGEMLTVLIKDPLPFERYFLDFTTAQASVTPDVASAILQGLTTDLAKVTFKTNLDGGSEEKAAESDCEALPLESKSQPGKGQVRSSEPQFQKCFAYMAQQAMAAYRKLDPFVAPDALTGPYSKPQRSAYAFEVRTQIARGLRDFISLETRVSTKITSMGKVPSELNPSADGKTPPLAYNAQDEDAITELSLYQKLFDSVAADLAGYAQRLSDLGACGLNAEDNPPDGQNVTCKYPLLRIDSRPDTPDVYKNMTTRTVTYSLDVLNVVSYSQQAAPGASNKKAIATVAINFADRKTVEGITGAPYTALRWEASAGVLFSWLPNRTFTLDSKGAVQDSKTRPTPLPFAAANYRLTGDLGGRWKQNIYLTGGIGININNPNAEFGVGPSYSWRALMINFLCHFGHDYRYTSTTPSGSSGNLPTVAHWTENPAIGISVRIPSLTGR